MFLNTVERARHGNHEAFDLLAEEHAPGLYRLAVLLAGADAAPDITQETLLRAWRELPRLRDTGKFPQWIRRILVNACRDHGRAERRRPTSTASVTHLEFRSNAEDLRQAEVRHDLVLELRRLSPEQRAVVALHYALDLPIREVAESLGIPVGTAKSRLNSALVALRHRRSEVGNA